MKAVSQPLFYKCRKRATISLSFLGENPGNWRCSTVSEGWSNGEHSLRHLALANSKSEHELWCEVRLRTHPASMWGATYNHKGSSMSSWMSCHLPFPLSSRLGKVRGDGEGMGLWIMYIRTSVAQVVFHKTQPWPTWYWVESLENCL